MKVYLVYCQRVDGEEMENKSTTHVTAVFSEKELAQKYADHWNEKQLYKWIHWVIEEQLDFYAETTKDYE